MNTVRRGLTVALVTCCVGGLFGQVAVTALYVASLNRIATASITDGGRRLLAAPLQLRVGERVPSAQVADHLRRIGYYDASVEAAGCYSAGDSSLTIHPRFAEFQKVTIHWSGDIVSQILQANGVPVDMTSIEPETLRSWDIGTDGMFHETLQRPVPIAALAGHPLLDALIASEEGRFREQHGIDLVRLMAAAVNGGGASTLAMQLSRQTILHDRERTLSRKFAEIGLAMAIDRKFTKDQILESYVSRIYLGTVGGRELRGFGAAAQALLGVADLRGLTLDQAATLVASLNRPDAYIRELRAGNSAPLRRQRDRVLRLIADRFPNTYAAADIGAAKAQPLVYAAPPPQSVPETIAGYFMEHATPFLPSLDEGRIYLTLDGWLQRAAVGAVTEVAARLDARVRGKAASRVQTALIAIDPHTGEILALVGGRSYDESPYNRATMGGRQVGSLVKPFDYLGAFERAADEGRTDLSADTIVIDQPTVFRFGGTPWAPRNYAGEYGGPITWRSALAHSKNIAAVKVAAWAGFPRVAGLWTRATGRPIRSVFPSLALGATEATPAQVAQAYMVFANGGPVRLLKTVSAVATGRGIEETNNPRHIQVARATSAAAVSGMMRAVFDVGTARSARRAGFWLPAAGKTGTTDDQRDAWFAGFTDDLLTVVWVGRDDNQPLGLTGAEAALPIWTEFMKAATARRRLAR